MIQLIRFDSLVQVRMHFVSLCFFLLTSFFPCTSRSLEIHFHYFFQFVFFMWLVQPYVLSCEFYMLVPVDSRRFIYYFLNFII